MKKISILDPSIASQNMGDHIIKKYCQEIFEEIFPKSFYAAIPTHDTIGKYCHRLMKGSDYCFFCGTNVLHCQMNRWRQWNITLLDTLYISNIILLGVGWWQYEDEKKINTYTKLLLKKLLASDYLHSVRDEYTKRKLQSIGVTNVLNTSCPSMWKLTEEHCEKIPKSKSDSVVFTLTDYKKDAVSDKKFLEILSQNYKHHYMWIQSFDDYGYFKSLQVKMRDVKFIGPSLEEYENVLLSRKVDYVGTRLHAGIFALNKGVRSVIIGVDNRATEISKDTGLLVVDRGSIEKELSRVIEDRITQRIVLSKEKILLWKEQFR